jgi:thymidine phosphorylase
MVELAGVSGDPRRALETGAALPTWRAMVAAQGGDPDAPLPVGAVMSVVEAPSTGVLVRLEARAIGTAAWRLGAGRARKEDPVSPGAGVICLAKPGDFVEKGQPLLQLLTDEAGRLDRAREALQGALKVTEDESRVPPAAPLVLERVG